LFRSVINKEKVAKTSKRNQIRDIKADKKVECSEAGKFLFKEKKEDSHYRAFTLPGLACYENYYFSLLYQIRVLLSLDGKATSRP
jgi:hypothetical protein